LPEKQEGLRTAVLRISLDRNPKVSYLFDLDKAWIVREPKLMFDFCMEVCEVLYGIVDQRRMAHIAMAIEDKIDELIKSRPARELDRIQIGEGSVEVNGGQKFYFPIEKEVENG
jgi:hypothetical protein